MVLSDGGTALLRGITPEDAERLVAFYSRVSEESKYLRFFAPYPRLSDADVLRFTDVDFVERVALIVTVADEMIAVGRYDVVEPGVAEVAFLVEDAHHNRGLAGVLLEHLAQFGREHGIGRFVAEVMPANWRMLGVFKAAGYTVTNTIDDGIVVLSLEIQPTDGSADVMSAREHRAEARSVQRLLQPQSVAVIGASRFADKAGQALLRGLLMGGFTGTVYPVNPAAETVAGLTSYPDLDSVPGPVDLAVVAIPVHAVPEVLAACARKGVKGLVVVSVTSPTGGVETGGIRSAERDLVRLARRHGMRLIGPNAFGAVNTDPGVRLNASLGEEPPARSPIGVYSQSGALGPVLLAALAARDLGVSSFVAAGHRGDVSANDMLQYFGEDAATDVVLLYLESVGNPRKFARVARRLSRSRPVVALRSGRTSGFARTDDDVAEGSGVWVDPAAGLAPVPPAERVDHAGHRVPPAAADALFAQSGVVLVESVGELADLASLFAFQPLPAGDRVAIIGNSGALQLLAADQVLHRGLRLLRPHDAVQAAGDLAVLEQRLQQALADPEADAVVVVLAPGQGTDLQAAAVAVSWASTATDKPVVACIAGRDRSPRALYRLQPDGTAGRGSVPWYPSVEPAVTALARAVSYCRWRNQEAGSIPELSGIDTGKARTLVDQLVAGRTRDDGELVTSAEDARSLLEAYGIGAWPAYPVRSEDEAVAVLADLDGEVVLKASSPAMRQRPDLADVWRNIATDAQMRAAWRSMTADLLADMSGAAAAEALGLVVQRMSPRGVPLVLRVRQDDTYGPVLSFGLAGLATDLLGDESYRVPPLSDAEAARMVRDIAAAPMLFGYHGGERVDLVVVEELLQRLARLAEDLPQAVFVELGPVLAGTEGCAVLGCRVWLEPAAAGSRTDWTARRLGLF